ncbi:hypothetical protein BpHYR1_043525 [Brachionus plicatilis]|uniref:Uncharacterized protein n=1 Tax=Brachionus plicatilis TaxID=10195 RepID=A0A3M7R8J3_BRAPC|nr:hypothetical protein BpHYR1_043525 [Brachionus plicatilis]
MGNVSHNVPFCSLVFTKIYGQKSNDFLKKSKKGATKLQNEYRNSMVVIIVYGVLTKMKKRIRPKRGNW